MAWMTGVMDEEEYQKHCVCRRERDAGDNVDGLGDPYRMWWHFTLVGAVASNVLLFLKKKSPESLSSGDCAFRKIRISSYYVYHFKSYSVGVQR